MKQSVSAIREELFARRNHYRERKNKIHSLFSGGAMAIAIGTFLLAMIVAPALLPRQPLPGDTGVPETTTPSEESGFFFITDADFEKVKTGMTKEDVAEVIGSQGYEFDNGNRWLYHGNNGNHYCIIFYPKNTTYAGTVCEKNLITKETQPPVVTPPNEDGIVTTAPFDPDAPIIQLSEPFAIQFVDHRLFEMLEENMTMRQMLTILGGGGYSLLSGRYVPVFWGDDGSTVTLDGYSDINEPCTILREKPATAVDPSVIEQISIDMLWSEVMDLLGSKGLSFARGVITEPIYVYPTTDGRILTIQVLYIPGITSDSSHKESLSLVAYVMLNNEPLEIDSKGYYVVPEASPDMTESKDDLTYLEKLRYGMPWSEARELLKHEYTLHTFSTPSINQTAAAISRYAQGLVGKTKVVIYFEYSTNSQDDPIINSIFLSEDNGQKQYLYTDGNGYFALPGSQITNPERFYDVTLFDQIEIGMTMTDVLKILGAPGVHIGSGTIIHRYYCSDGSSSVITYMINSEFSSYTVVGISNDRKTLVPPENAISLSAIEQVKYGMSWREARDLLGDNVTVISANSNFVSLEYIVAYEGRAIITLSPHVYSEADRTHDPAITFDDYADFPVRSISVNGRELPTDRFGYFFKNLDSINPNRLFSVETFPILTEGMSASKAIERLHGFGVLHTLSLPDMTMRRMFYLSNGSIRYVVFAYDPVTLELTITFD